MYNSLLKTGLATGLAIGVAGPLLAGGLNEPMIAPAPVAPTVVVAQAAAPSGDWTGFYVGAQLGYGQLSSDQIVDEPEDVTYGVHAGYLYDLGRFVLGGEVDYDMTEIGFDAPGVDLDSVTRLKLRAGYDAGQFLPYVVAGGAQAKVSGALDGATDGVFAGLGVDYQLSESFRVGAEVLVHRFEDLEESGVDVDATTVSLRAAYNF